MTEWSTVWAGAISVLVVAVPALFAWRQHRDDNLVATENHQTENHMVLINELQEEVRSLREARTEDSALIRKLTSDYRELERRLYSQEQGIRKLLEQIVEIGHEPRWNPEGII